jgi:hypothetical protein
MRNTAQVKRHNIYAVDDYLIPKLNRPLFWKPSKKKTKVTKRRKNARQS